MSETPNEGNCNKLKADDIICLRCENGSCPETATFDITDGFILHACTVRTQVSKTECKEIWEKGTCPGGYWEPQ
jgi:hypothetical protein